MIDKCHDIIIQFRFHYIMENRILFLQPTGK